MVLKIVSIWLLVFLHLINLQTNECKDQVDGNGKNMNKNKNSKVEIPSEVANENAIILSTSASIVEVPKEEDNMSEIQIVTSNYENTGSHCDITLSIWKIEVRS